jgi:hypothetical protein
MPVARMGGVLKTLRNEKPGTARNGVGFVFIALGTAHPLRRDRSAKEGIDNG